jgi:hypothetical protein
MISTYLTRIDVRVLAAAVVISAGLAVQPTSASVPADPSRPAAAHTPTAVLKLALDDPILCGPYGDDLSDFCNPTFVKNYDGW